MAIITDTHHDPVEPRGSLLDRPLSRFVTWDRALILLGVLLLAAIASRFWLLGERALHHDESLHAIYSYYLSNGGNYQHQPMMHGPLLFHLTAFGYWLFGDSDFTARLVPALLGVLLVWAPWKLRPWLGKRGALAASLLILISPVMLYYSRFIRHDIFAAAWTVLIVYGMWAYLRGGRFLHLLLMVIGWAFLFSQKEVSFLIAFIFWSYLALQLLVRWWQARRQEQAFPLREQREWALLVVIGCLLLPFVTAAIMHLPTVLNRTFNLSLPIWDPGLVGGNSETSVYNSAAGWPTAFKLRGYGTLLLLMGLGIFIASRLWKLKETLIAAGLFFGIVILLHTTFLTNLNGIGSGFIGALGYWIEQHDVRRGEQPWYYYAMLLPLYEFLPLLIVAVGGPLLAWKGWQRRTRERPVRPVATLDTVAAWPWFLLWWTVMAFAIFSVAGEKMPWLLVHLSLPLILLAATVLGRALGGVRLALLRDPEAWLTGLLILLATLALLVLVSLLLTGVGPFRGMDEVSLLGTARWLLAAIFLLATGWGISAMGERFSRAQVAQIAAVAFLLPLTLATVRFALIASFRNGDIANEPLIFVQSSPSVTTFVHELDALSERLYDGNEIRIAYDSETSWPFEWYLRHYPNRIFYGSDPNSQAEAIRNADVVIGGPPVMATLNSMLPGYPSFDYPMRWWFPEEYKKLIQRVDETGATVEDKSLSNVLSRLKEFAMQPQYRVDFLDFLLNRRLVQPLGGQDFRVYYSPDIATRVWSSTTPREMTSPPADDLQALAPSQVIGGFQTPRAVAPLPDGRLAVADTLSHTISIVAADGSVEGSFGGQGEEPGQFNEPWGIAAAPDGTLYVADTWNHRIQHVTTQGEVLHLWGSFGDTGGQLGVSGQFYGPRGVAVSADGRVWVTDTGNARVQVFGPDGTFQTQFGGRGSEAGQFSEPVGIAIAPNGTVWIADTWNQRIQSFSADLAPMGQVAVAGWAGQNVENKPSVAASDERVWITDPEQGLIVEYDRAGNRLRAWGGAGQLLNPMGLALADGTLWVADSGNARVVAFDTAPGP